jgi:predicted AlkP superfamily pyrophosphatase or phosphodiesterase
MGSWEVMSGRHFLLVGVDGVRFDRLLTADTPNLDAISARGGLRTARIPPQNPTMSGPQWATILTGVWSDRHGVRRNWRRSRSLAAYPDLLTRAGAADPAANVHAAVSWPPLGLRAGCGPILQTPAFVPNRHPTTLASWVRSDEAVVEASVDRLRDPDLTAAFVYLGQVDIVGHLGDVGTGYRAAIETVDAHIGRLVAAIESTGERDAWTILVTTDHGHRDRGGHGTRTDPETTVWFACDTIAPGWDTLDSAGVADYLLGTLAG